MSDTTPGRRIRGLDAGERREQRRRAVLDASLALFAEHGYAATSIEQICQAAYVSTKSFYELFASRDACYEELHRELSEALQREMVARLEGLAGEVPEAEVTEALLGAFLDAIVSDPRRAHVLLGRARMISPSSERLRRENRRWAAAFVNAVWQRFGVEGDNSQIAVALIGGMFDLITVWLIDGDLADEIAVGHLRQDLGRFYWAVRRGLTTPAVHLAT
jgi:AcrR family transcriptional regulator